MKSLLRGTFFLAFVLLISKLFGFIYRMMFNRIAGEEAVGLYMSVYPTFIFFIAVVQLGLPIAITKLVAQFDAVKNKNAQIAVMKKAHRISIYSLMVWLPILFFISPYITTTLLHSHDAFYTLIVAICALPVVIWSSLFRAYLQGIDKISISAWGTLLEQIIRITLLTFLLPLVTLYPSFIIAACTMGITFIGEVVSLLFHFIFYRIYKPKKVATTLSTNTVLKIALPSAGSKLFGSFTWFLEPIIFLQALMKSGLTASRATTIYGMISNVHIPLLLFPAFIPQALAIVLIPSVSSLQATLQIHAINHQLHETIRLCSVIACYACATFFIIGDQLAIALFHITESHWMSLLAPIFYFYFIQAPLHAILQGLNFAHIAMKNTVLGGCLKLFALYFLASHPSLQIDGAIIAIGIGVFCTSFMHIASVQAIPQILLKWRTFLIPYVVFLMTIFISIFFNDWTVQLIISLCFLTISLIVGKQIRLSDIQLLLRIRQRFTLHK